MSVVGVYSAIYNSADYVEEMINSIKNQTFEDWELSMVDDGSQDNGFHVAMKASKDDPRIQVTTIPHCGIVGKVKNKAISLFRGNPRYCCGVDSDDYIAPQALELFVNFLDRQPEVGAACGSFVCFDETGKQWMFNHAASKEDFNSETLLRYMNFFPLRFYRKMVYDIVGGYSEELTNADDYDLALKIDEVTRIRRIATPVTYFYRQHGQQISSRVKGEEDFNAKKALEAALGRRGLKGSVINDRPPFVIKNAEKEHFIWGRK